MTFATLALIVLIGCAGPLLATPARWHLPIVLGELVAGVLVGPSGFDALDASNETFTFLASLGFALVMFVAGSHVPVRDASLRSTLGLAAARAAGVGVVSVGLALGISALFGVSHVALYAVLIASSSAALVLPIRDSLQLEGPAVLAMLTQVAVADTACIVALPLAIDPAHAGRAAIGAVTVAAAAGVLFVLLREAERRRWRRRVHKLSEARKFALELRINLFILFALAALAVRSHVSVMLAGFAFGLVVSGIGEPRRLARQLFALADGFLSPLFFVWLGASIDLRALSHHVSFVGLGAVLGFAAVAAHGILRVFGQPISLGMLAAAQLGVPIAAATIGSQLHVLRPGEPAAILLGALVTIVLAIVGSALAARRAARAQAT
jgi:Kef-type K+ transport system membrane component KefB